MDFGTGEAAGIEGGPFMKWHAFHGGEDLLR